MAGVEFSERSLSLTSLMAFMSLLSTLSMAFDFSFSAAPEDATSVLDRGLRIGATAALDSSSNSGSDSHFRWPRTAADLFLAGGGQFGAWFQSEVTLHSNCRMFSKRQQGG